MKRVLYHHDEDEQFSSSISKGQRVILVLLIVFLIPIIAGITYAIRTNIFAFTDIISDKSNPADPSLKNLSSTAAQSSKLQKLMGEFTLNIPAIFNDKVLINADTFINGNTFIHGDASISGKLTAPNIIYSINAGENITITGDKQNPVISAIQPAIPPFPPIPPSVLSLQGKQGALKLAAGSGIVINDLEINNTDPGSSQNIFKTITGGSTSFSAGSNADTLTFAAGTGMTISSDTASKTLTFAASVASNSGVLSLTGTANQVAVSASTGHITLSLPQNIHTGASPTFNSLQLAGNTNQITLGTGNTGTLTMSPLSTNRTYTLPDATGTICLTTGNCAGVGGSLIGSGTVGQIAFFNANNSITSETTGFTWDATNDKLGLGNDTPSGKLDVNGAVTGKALTILNETGNQDILTASSSGTTRFVISNTGNLTAGTYNGNTITPGSGTLTLGAGKTLTANNSLAFSGTDGTAFTFPGSSGTVVTLDAAQILTNKTIAAGSNTITGLTNANLSGSAGITNANLANSSVTVNSGTGISGGGSIALGGAITLTNTGVTSAIAGTGISLSGGTGAVTITNAGVTSLAGTLNQVNVSGPTGAVTLTLPQDINSSANPTFATLNLTSNTNQLVLGTTNTGTITMNPLGAPRTYTLPDASGIICLSGQTCSSSGTLGYFNRNTTTLTPSTLADRLILTDGATSDTANFRLEVNGKQTGKALVGLNETGNQDIFTASASGVTRFTIANNGNIQINNLSTGIAHVSSTGVLSSSSVGLGGSDVSGILTVAKGGTGQDFSSVGQGAVPYFSATGVMNTLPAGTTGQCLTTSGPSANPSWSPCTGTNYWQMNNGAISPFSNTLDLLIGQTATTSAKFGLLNVNSGTPTASISAGLAGATYLTANGTLQTTANQTLFLGGSTTGNIILNGDSTDQVAIGTQTPPSWATLYVAGDVGTSSDFILSDGQSLDWGDASTYISGSSVTDSIQFITNASQKAEIDANGNFMINTTTPLATFDVHGNSGTTPVASFSGQTAMAGLVVDNRGAGDLFTASKSGATKFVINNAGNVQINNLSTGIAHVSSNGVLSSSPVALGGADVSGTLSTTNGGTGQNFSGVAQGAVPYFSGVGVMNTLAPGTVGNCLQTNGPSANPTWGPCAGANYFQRNSTTISPAVTTDRLLLADSGTTTNHRLEVNGKETGKALVALNETGNQDIFTASASGTTRFTISNAGNVTGGTYNGNTITPGSGTLTLGAGKTLTANNSLAFSGTDATTITFQGTDTYVGRGTTDTLTNKTLTAPKLADLGFLADPNGNEYLILDSNASAVNELTIANAATGNGPTIAATGGDPNVPLSLDTKGTGALNLNNTGTGNILLGGGSASTGCTVTNATGAFACTAAVTGSNISGTNTGDQTITLTGDVTGSGTGSFATTISADAVALGTDTTGNYVGTITGGSGISSSGATSGEGINHTLSLGPLTADWDQTGAFDIALNNSSSELKIRESSGTLFGIFDVGDLSSSDKTYTFPDASGTVCLSGQTCASSGTIGYLTRNTTTITPSTLSDRLLLTDGATTDTTNYRLEVNGKQTGKALVALNETGNQDILTASSSGTTRFTISNTGNLTAGTYNGNTITQGSGTLTLGAGKTLTTSNTLTLAGTDATTLTFQGTDTYVGRGTTDTLTNKTLTAPKLADLGFLADPNGNEYLILDSNASAVNEITLANAATGNGPTIAATGGDPNVPLSLDAKGTGALNINNTGTGNILLGGGSASTGCTVTNATGAFACTAAITGSNISGTNTGDQTITLTGDVTGSGTGSFATTIGANAVDGTNIALGSDAQGDLMYYNGTDWARLAAGSSGTCLKTNGAGADPAWSSCAAGTNYWQLTSGALSPFSNTADLLIGNTSTASAKFAFINVNSGSPTATISGNLSLVTPGGANPAAKFNILNGGSLEFKTSPGGDAGLLSTLFLGNNGFVGVNTNIPNSMFEVAAPESRFNFFDDPNDYGAYVGGGIHFLPWNRTTNNNVLFNSFEANTGYVFMNNNGTNELFRVTGDGSFGIGTPTPLAKLDVRGISGTLPVASISGRTAKAAMIVDNNGVGDLFTASKSGKTHFVVTNAGNVGIGTPLPIEKLDVVGNASASGNLTLYAGARSIQTTSNNTLTIGGSSTGNIALSPRNGTGTVSVDGDLVLSNTSGEGISGGGLTDCDASNSKLLWNSADNQFSCGTDRASVAITKSSDESVSNTTFQPDNDFTFSIGTNDTYIFHITVPWSSTASSAVPKYRVTAPSGATCVISGHGSDPSGSGADAIDVGCSGTLTFGNAVSAGMLNIYGTVVTNGTGGNVALEWAANGAGTLTFKNGSSLYAFKVNGADLAEAYYTKDETIQPGDIVQVDGSLKAGVKKTERQYESHSLGIISTKPGIVLGDDTVNKGRPVFLALAGRIPVKISTENGQIEPGDYLTTSSIPGVAMKATHAGQMIGKALESYTNDNPDAVGSILVFTNLSWADPSLTITADGDINSDSFSAADLNLSTLSDSQKPKANSSSPFSALVNTLQNLNASVSATRSQSDKQQSQLEKLQAQYAMLTSKVASTEAKIATSSAAVIGNNTDGLAFETDSEFAFNPDSFNDKLATSSSVVALNKDLASVTDRLSFLELQASSSALLGTNGSSGFTASSAAEVGIDKLDVIDETVSNSLTVLGRTLLSDVGITGKITTGLLTINGLNDDGFAAINTTSGPLKLQSDGFNGVDILNGKVTIDPKGNIKTDGFITAKKINIEIADTLSASLGESVLPAGQTKLVIKTSAVTDKSKIFITPKTKTDLPLSVTSQTNGKTFTVEVTAPSEQDIKFNWWIVN